MFAVLVAFLFWLALNGRLALYGGFAVKQGRAAPGAAEPHVWMSPYSSSASEAPFDASSQTLSEGSAAGVHCARAHAASASRAATGPRTRGIVLRLRGELG